ncbi:hypothetical protein V1264_002575 [Littorina saxatilis]|uniref:Uncharacterized protein n=1 Tax=Littorina saxatilis TaxID=31220 RepID=A0AAN9B3K9_9CAEN
MALKRCCGYTLSLHAVRGTLCLSGACFVRCVRVQCDRNFAVWDVLREEEFSPLKNADGAAKDTPTTCRNDLCALHRRYAIAAGAVFVHADGTPYTDIQSKQNGKADGQSTHDTDDTVSCEISPLISYAGEGLEEVKGVKLCPPVILELSPDSKLDIRQGSQ